MPLTIFDLIELRAFSSVWYWILVALIWTRAINAPLGVPLDLLRLAESGDDQAQRDLEARTEIELRRRTGAGNLAPVWQVALWAFVLSVLTLSAGVYGIEVAQALLLLAAPLALVALTVARTGRVLLVMQVTGAELRRRLFGLKLRVQVIGLLAVFVSAIWGMYFNLSAYIF